LGMCSGRVLRSGCCLARCLEICGRRLPYSLVVLLGVWVLRRGLPSVRCSCRWFSMLDSGLIGLSSLGGYGRLRLSPKIAMLLYISALGGIRLPTWFYSEKVKVEAWNFLLQTCMCRISSCFYLFRTKTFGAVIKFCIISPD
jgi:hypothetical protein